MTAPIADLDSGFAEKTLLTNVVHYWVTIPIGASGATGTLKDCPNGVACAKSATGVYDVTGLPPVPATTTAEAKVCFTFTLQSPAATVTEAIVSTAPSLANGTVSFRTSKGGTATEPASGDVITLHVWAQRE